MVYDIIKKCPLKILPGSLVLLALLLLFSSLIDAITPTSIPHSQLIHELSHEKNDKFHKDKADKKNIGEVFLTPQ